MQLTAGRRHAISTALALLLALESVTVVAATAGTSASQQVRHVVPAAPPAGLVRDESSATGQARIASVPAVVRVPPAVGPTPATDDVPAIPAIPAIPAVVVPAPAAVSPPAGSPSGRRTIPERPAGQSASSPTRAPSAAPPRSSTYSGRNHLWIPALRISRSISAYACSRTSALRNLVYRWGCAGTNNLYLMGHASSVFKPLHDAYVAGRLAVGMKAWYADSKGRVHLYVVKWWKTTRPTGASWAYAAQRVPSMTLQTCLGAHSEYRLIVHLVEVNR